MSPYFSVITPSFNQGGFIAKCLQSVADQNARDYEHLIFDNCSNDETSQVVEQFPDVVFRSEPDRGQSDAVNKGFLAAQGEIICWLNSDDAYPPGLFVKLREIFADDSVNVVFGDVKQVAYDGSKPQRGPAFFENRLDLVKWWSSKARLHQPAIFFRRSVRESVGLLRKDLHYAMDYEYWWRMSENHPFRYLPEVLAIQHRQLDSKTVIDWHKVYEERQKIFAPEYGLIDGGHREALLQEKRAAMSLRFLGEAFAAAPLDRSFALRCLLRAFQENSRLVLKPQWLGVLRRMAFSTGPMP